MSVLFFGVSSDLGTYRCVSRCESNLWEGRLGVRMSGGSCVWVYVLMSVCIYYQVSGYQGRECAGSVGRCLGLEVWVGLGVVCLGTGTCLKL